MVCFIYWLWETYRDWVLTCFRPVFRLQNFSAFLGIFVMPKFRHFSTPGLFVLGGLWTAHILRTSSAFHRPLVVFVVCFAACVFGFSFNLVCLPVLCPTTMSYHDCVHKEVNIPRHSKQFDQILAPRQQSRSGLTTHPNPSHEGFSRKGPSQVKR